MPFSQKGVVLRKSLLKLEGGLCKLAPESAQWTQKEAMVPLIQQVQGGVLLHQADAVWLPQSGPGVGLLLR